MWFVFYSNVLYVCFGCSDSARGLCFTVMYVCFGCSDSACGLCFTVMYCMCALDAQTVYQIVCYSNVCVVRQCLWFECNRNFRCAIKIKHCSFSSA